MLLDPSDGFPSLLAQGKALKPWLPSGRCGEGRTAPDGTTPAQCDPTSDKPCCSANNWCGGSADHCSRGVNYAKVDPSALRTSGVPGSIGGVPLIPKDLDWPTTANRRQYPILPSQYAEEPEATANMLAEVEAALRNEETAAAALPDLGHFQQVTYRVLSHLPKRADAVRAKLPLKWRLIFDKHISARRDLHQLGKGKTLPKSLPDWKIVQPESASSLLSYYDKAEKATGISWPVLAAINLIKSNMGRISGAATRSGAEGPMQMTTAMWSEAGGKGTITSAHDSIQAAARYLLKKGSGANGRCPCDLRAALLAWNANPDWGSAAMHYHDLMKEDRRAYYGLYNWEVHVASAEGDLWLPVGFGGSGRINAAEYLSQMPAAAPPNGSSVLPNLCDKTGCMVNPPKSGLDQGIPMG